MVTVPFSCPFGAPNAGRHRQSAEEKNGRRRHRMRMVVFISRIHSTGSTTSCQFTRAGQNRAPFDGSDGAPNTVSIQRLAEHRSAGLRRAFRDEAVVILVFW